MSIDWKFGWNQKPTSYRSVHRQTSGI